MKKLFAVLIAITMLLSAIGVLAVTVSADEAYTVVVTEQAGFSTETTSTTNEPVVFAGGSAATDAVVSATCSYLVEVTAVSATAVRKYTLIVDGTEHAAWIQANYNAGSNKTTVFITLPEGTYTEVIARGTDEEGVSMDILKFTNITVTAAENTVPDDKEVDYTPCWTLSASALSEGNPVNRCGVALSELGYVTFTATTSGDPYLQYIGGTATKVGRWLLVKYNNHSVIPRMQLYMAQAAGITSDNNMIEFPIAANGSGWTYAIVDMATNQFYDKENQTVQHFRFDPLEARNWSGGSYQFTGEESIDVAYIMGFTTRAGLMGYLEANELHDVTKTAVLKESQVTMNGDKATYTDENGVTWDVTKNEDGTYSYTFEKKDVRIPCDTTPKMILDGSRLTIGNVNAATLEMDSATGITTVNVTGADPYATFFSESRTAGRYMAFRYKTTVQDKTEFFLSSTEAGPTGGQSFMRELNADGAWHTDIVDLSTMGVSTLNTETYELKFLRVDFFDGASSGTMELEFIAFFDSEDAAYQYMHEYKTYTATFMANGKVVERVIFEAGATSIKEPAVPEKEGFTGKWKAYTLANKNLTIMAEYTLIEKPTTATETDAPKPTDTEEPTSTKEEPTSAQTTATEAQTSAPDSGTPAPTGTNATTAAGKTSGGCKSVLGGLSVLLIAAGAAVTLAKRKHN